jgi:hypothetical protein
VFITLSLLLAAEGVFAQKAPPLEDFPGRRMEDMKRYLSEMVENAPTDDAKSIYLAALGALTRGQLEHPAFTAALEEFKRQNSIRRVLMDVESMTAAYSLYAIETRSETQNITDLAINPGRSGWNGPYVEQQPPIGGEFGLYDVFFAPFTPMGLPQPGTCTASTADTLCLVWLRLTDLPDWVVEEVEVILDRNAEEGTLGGVWRAGPAINGRQDAYYTLAEVLFP